MLKIQVLGQPAEDNALYVQADSGQGITRLLLDCGAGTVGQLAFADIQQIDHLLLSHLHIDHISGFDDFFRVNFDRQNKENHIWGPPETARILGHRFQGFWWNHAADHHASWLVHEVGAESVQTFRFEAREAFAHAYAVGSQARRSPLIQTPQLSVEAVDLQHHGPSLGFILREPERVNINPSRLAALGLKGGAWLSQLKAEATGDIQIGEQLWDADDLRQKLTDVQQGDSAAYLTDFLLSEAELERLAPLLAGVKVLYLEAQYAPEDLELATKNHHTTVQQGATLAQRAGASELRLLHLSRRYAEADWRRMLEAAQAMFPATTFAEGWLS